MQLTITIDNNNQIHFRETEIDTKTEEKGDKKNDIKNLRNKRH